jgi:hypothetical protein
MKYGYLILMLWLGLATQSEAGLLILSSDSWDTVPLATLDEKRCEDLKNNPRVVIDRLEKIIDMGEFAFQLVGKKGARVWVELAWNEATPDERATAIPKLKKWAAEALKSGETIVAWQEGAKRPNNLEVRVPFLEKWNAHLMPSESEKDMPCKL